MAEEEIIVYDQGEGNDKAIIEVINAKLNMELRDPKVFGALLATTFKGLDATKAKQALMEGMIRGFEFKDFLHKNVYAIPFKTGYSLVTSIDHARKRGMRSGVIGVGAPVYEFTDEKRTLVETCSVTVKRLVGDHIGEFTATVYFSEYTTNTNLWASKPRTMIAKVAEMHALRKACPEEMAAMYTEEEIEKEVQQPNRYQDATKTAQSLKMGTLQKNDNQKQNNQSKTETQQATDSHPLEDTAEPAD